ncbi:hypothetical protein [Parablautia muri]|uniref:Uncharacterized protein n=1 Tax=Parablautia muri TaxID=2320879 RepID=A0A9X5BGZ2_9FIRM|nr:hypothetical protein [Parablautia muri]NBJ93467.1 hypothetical protein [Parablautia muri]
MEKYLYVQGFCKEIHYTGLYPVAYRKGEQDNLYKKTHMSCACLDGACGSKETCDLLKDAPEVIDPEKEWRLRERMKGTKE